MTIEGPILITGGAGFIGSHLAHKFLSEGYETHVIDNLSSGFMENIQDLNQNDKFKFFEFDLLDIENKELSKNYRTVFHCAANPEVKVSVINPKIHLEQNIIATFKLLEKIKNEKINEFIFISTSTVYGDAKKLPTPESYPIEPISPYGASKAACEALISSYAHSFNFKATIFRLANIIGPRSKHGVIFDLLEKLKQKPISLEVLGDGTQTKSYMHITDLMTAIECGINNSEIVSTFNIGSDDSINVKTIAKMLIENYCDNQISINYTGGVDGGRGWKGDVKNMQLDASSIRSKGWQPKYNSYDAAKLTISELVLKLK